MKPEQALEILKANEEKTTATNYLRCKNVAIEALEKQIPKKPVVVDEDYIFEKDEWEKDYECPNCGNPYIDDSYCSCCGQKLDWSDAK